MGTSPLLVLVLLLVLLLLSLLLLLLLSLLLLLLGTLLPWEPDGAAGSPSATPPASAPGYASRVAVSMGPTSVSSRSDSLSKTSSTPPPP